MSHSTVLKVEGFRPQHPALAIVVQLQRKGVQLVVASELLQRNRPRSHFQPRFGCVENSYGTHACRCGYGEQVVPMPRYDCPGEFHVWVEVLVGDGAFDRARANAFQSIMPSSDDLVGLLKLLVVMRLILQFCN